jgi:PAS domain S-box-containing protein
LIPFDAISGLDPEACPIILDNIFEKSSTGLAIFARNFNYVWVNASFASYTGVPKDDHAGKSVREILGDEAWTEIRPLLESAVRGKAVIQDTVTKPVRSPKASVAGIRTSYIPMENNYHIFGVLVMVNDFSLFIDAETKLLESANEERKTHEHKLQEQEGRLQLALEGGKFGTWQLSLVKEELIDASDICKACFGFAPNEPLTYTDIVNTIHPDDLPGVLAAVENTRETGRQYRMEYRCIFRDHSEHWISAFAQPTFDSDGMPVTLIGICQDISDRRAAEREKSELLATIRQFAVMQAAFLRDVLASVTDGKLRFCQSPAELPGGERKLVGKAILLTAASGLTDLRHFTKQAAQELGFSDERWQDLITAASEAGMNAVVHAGGGVARVSVVNEKTVRVWVSDTGKGIDLENLPRAALEKGYTTTGTMGHGMKIILQTVDRVWLMTGPGGTVMVIEQDKEPVKRGWM